MPTLCILEVVPPERSDLVLTAHVPHCETDVLVLYSLHIESCETQTLSTYSVITIKQCSMLIRPKLLASVGFH